MQALRWQRQQGRMLPTWQRLIDMGREVPDAYYDRPEIYAHLLPLLEAFHELGTERQSGGMEVGSIPRSKIKAYLIEELGLDGDHLDRAIKIIRMADDDYVISVNKPQKPAEFGEIVKPDDAVGIKHMMRRIGGRSKKRQPRLKAPANSDGTG